jgi:hypothetical protein
MTRAISIITIKQQLIIIARAVELIPPSFFEDVSFCSASVWVVSGVELVFVG